jgi:hypothetical protein
MELFSTALEDAESIMRAHPNTMGRWAGGPGLSIGGPDEVEVSPDPISPGMSVGPSRGAPPGSPTPGCCRSRSRCRCRCGGWRYIVVGWVVAVGRCGNGGRTLCAHMDSQLLVTEMKRTRLASGPPIASGRRWNPTHSQWAKGCQGRGGVGLEGSRVHPIRGGGMASQVSGFHALQAPGILG